MTYADYIIEQTREAAKQTFKYAKAVPADKVDWKPEEKGRSVLDMCKELAQCPNWSVDILSGKGIQWSEPDPNALATVAECEAQCEKNLEALYTAIKEFPEDRYKETYILNFGEGDFPITMKENIEYPAWNLTYHQGQIAYIQTLYGDTKMYN